MAKPAKAQSTEVAARRSPNLLSRWQEDVDRMEQMFENFWPSRLPRLFDWDGRPSSRTVAAPPVDVYEEGDNVVIKAEIPGVRKEDIEVNVTDSTLTINGEKERKEEVHDGGYYRCERSYGAFSRTVELPAEVQTGKAEARFAEGILEIRIPKTNEAKRRAVKLKIK